MYVKSKDGTRFVNVTPSNFDSVSVDSRNNVIFVLSGKTAGIGVYEKLNETKRRDLTEMLFQIVRGNIDSDIVYNMPQDEDSLAVEVEKRLGKNRAGGEMPAASE